MDIFYKAIHNLSAYIINKRILGSKFPKFWMRMSYAVHGKKIEGDDYYNAQNNWFQTSLSLVKLETGYDFRHCSEDEMLKAWTFKMWLNLLPRFIDTYFNEWIGDNTWYENVV